MTGKAVVTIEAFRVIRKKEREDERTAERVLTTPTTVVVRRPAEKVAGCTCQGHPRR
jgi:hypothetical protein